MPSIQDIEKFNASLVSIGDEPAVLRERGEKLEGVGQPSDGMPPDLSELLDDGTAPGEPEESGDDLGEEDFLQSFAAAMQQTEEEADAETDPFADMDLDLSFADEDQRGGAEDTDEDLIDEGPIDEAPGAEALDEITGDEELESPSDVADEGFEFGDDLDLGDFEEASEEAAAEDDLSNDLAGEAEPPAAADDYRAEDFSLDDLSFDDEDLGGEAPGEEPGDDFDFGDDFAELGGAEDFSLDAEPEGEAAGRPSAGEELAELDEQDEFSFDLEADDELGDEGRVPDPGDEFSFDAEDRGEEPGDLEAGDFDDIDQFSLDDFGAEFGVTEEEELGGHEDRDIDEEDEEAPSAAPSAEDIELSDDEFAAVQQTLATLPLNLKIEVEELIAQSHGTTEQLRRLLKLLIDAESPRTIADYAGKILGKRIDIPRGYEKRTGVDFERERQTFAYRFRETILPVLRVVAAAMAVIGVLSFLGYQLVYRPLRARSLYVTGYEDIQQEQYVEANRNFDRAHDTWVMERWFFRYADAFAEQRQYGLAAEKYDQLLFGMSDVARAALTGMLNRRAYDDILSIRNINREGVLAYAEMESEVVANYQKADRLLGLLLAENMYDYDALLAKGDNAMAWAREDGTKYEDARVAYASLIQEYGETDTLLFRMLRYFIRTDNEEEVIRLKRLFQSDPGVDVEPDVYAELGGYLIDKSRLQDVRDILFRAMDQRSDLPEIHYHLARYFRRIDEPTEEEKGLQNTLVFLDAIEALSPRRLEILADTYGRLGELNYGRRQFLTAEEHFRSGIDVYEGALDRGLVDRSAMFGRLYAGLGDINYYVALDYDVADRLYRRAENHGYTSRDVDFRQGYIDYRNGAYDAALQDFHDAAGGFSRNLNLIYATANTLYYEQSFFAAEAYYRELLDRLQVARAQIQNLLVDEDPEHRRLVEYLIRANNNLGITLNRLSRMTGDERLGSEGMVHLNRSSEYAENLARDPRTMERAGTINLAFLNTREILYPQPNYELQLYAEIPRDFQDVTF